MIIPIFRCITQQTKLKSKEIDGNFQPEPKQIRIRISYYEIRTRQNNCHRTRSSVRCNICFFLLLFSFLELRIDIDWMHGALTRKRKILVYFDVVDARTEFSIFHFQNFNNKIDSVDYWNLMISCAVTWMHVEQQWNAWAKCLFSIQMVFPVISAGCCQPIDLAKGAKYWLLHFASLFFVVLLRSIRSFISSKNLRRKQRQKKKKTSGSKWVRSQFLGSFRCKNIDIC